MDFDISSAVVANVFFCCETGEFVCGREKPIQTYAMMLLTHTHHHEDVCIRVSDVVNAEVYRQQEAKKTTWNEHNHITQMYIKSD